MRKAVIPFVLSMGLIAVWAVPAGAASTRAEYIAQVDPMCAASVGPENDAAQRVIKNLRRLGSVANSGKAKGFVKQTRRTAGSITQLATIDSNLTDQISAVPPPSADAGTIASWLSGRRQSDASLNSAATALRQYKFRVFLKRLKQAGAADSAAKAAVSGFGFQVCGVVV